MFKSEINKSCSVNKQPKTRCLLQLVIGPWQKLFRSVFACTCECLRAIVTLCVCLYAGFVCACTREQCLKMHLHVLSRF